LNYQETLDYLYAALPVFHRIGPAAYKHDLGNTLALMEILDHPETAFPAIHIAGTNGKGSVSSMLSAIFTKAGYKTGLYTSPHLQSFTERIRINGIPIPEQTVAEWVAGMVPVIDEMKPSFFEITVAMCFDYFRKEGVEIAIVETGLGGRLDSTNVVHPVLSVITNISYDHMDLLGDTLEKIAFEKAGIIKQGRPCVLGSNRPEVIPVFKAKAEASQSSLVMASEVWLAESGASAWPQSIWRYKEVRSDRVLTVKTDLSGDYQQENIQTVLAACTALEGEGYSIPEEVMLSALENVGTLSGLKGRMQKLGMEPLILTDVGHNADGIQKVMRQLQALSYRRLHIVIGMVSDKDRAKVLSELPQSAQYYFVQPQLPRALAASQLKGEGLHYHLSGEAYTKVSLGIDAALAQAGKEDLIFIGGSTFVVAEALDYFDSRV
jgi:dihydrofolate synthase / folylpolyglutamate synthase